MQINPFGFPLGAGTQPLPAFGEAGLGFAAALGVAIEGSAPPQLMSLKASATPPQNLDPKLSRTLLAQVQLDVQIQPVPTGGALPGLQQPTSLSELMATAAKLPATESLQNADPMPSAHRAPVADRRSAVDAVPSTGHMPAARAVVETDQMAAPAIPVAQAPVTAEAGPSTIAPAASAPVAALAGPAEPADAELPIEAAMPSTATPAETAPAKPQKGTRIRTVADAEPVQPDAAKPAVLAEMLVTGVPPQPIAQQQSAPRDAAVSRPDGAPVAKAGKTAPAAPIHDATQAVPGTGGADFARAVAAKSESTDSESSPDGQPQPETRVTATATRPDAAAPVLPQATPATATTDPVRVAAAPAAEPVIEARAGHLGQSLGVEIARKVELGEETLRIRLNPIELGRIEVTLAFDDKGSLQATVRTESAQAMDLLRQDAPDLARTLDQAGVRTDAQSFRFENRGGDGGGQQAQQQQQQQQNRGQFASSDDDAGAAEPIYRPVRSDGQVDLLA